MKGALIIILILISGINISAQGEVVDPLLKTSISKKNIIKTSLIAPIGRAFDISYERLIGPEVSLILEVVLAEDVVQISPQLRYYLSDDLSAPSGTFIAPMIMLGSEISGAGLMVGRQKIFKEKISLDAFIGPAYYTEGVAIWGGLNVGITF